MIWRTIRIECYASDGRDHDVLRDYFGSSDIPPSGYPQCEVAGFDATLDAGKATYTGTLNGTFTLVNGVLANQGQTLTFNAQSSALPFICSSASDIVESVSTISLTLTLAQTSFVDGYLGNGNLSGTLSVTGEILDSPLTLSRSISGTYQASYPQ